MRDALVKQVADLLDAVGETTLFALRVLAGVPRRAGRGTYVPIFYAIGFNSIPVVAVTGLFMGVVGGEIICVWVYHVERHYYWLNTQGYVTLWDLTTGLIKPTAFGVAIALVSCHRGLNSEPGAEGVGRAATRAFVASFIAVL